MPKIQSEGFNILDLTNPAEVVYKTANKGKDISNKVSLDDVIKIADASRKVVPDPKKMLLGPIIFRTGITLTNNEKKCIMKVILSL